MAWQLVADVLDHAPPDLPAIERLALVAIAEWARVETRVCQGRTLADLAHRIGLPPDSTRRLLHRLKERDLELRVPIGTAKDDRPIYAVRGRSLTFRVPVLPPPPSCSCDTCARADHPSGLDNVKADDRSGLNGGLRADDSSRKGGRLVPLGRTTRPVRADDSSGPSVIRSTEDPSTRARADAAAVRDELQSRTTDRIDLDWATNVIRNVLDRAEGEVRNPTAYIVKAIAADPDRYLPTRQPPRRCVVCEKSIEYGNRCDDHPFLSACPLCGGLRTNPRRPFCEGCTAANESPA